MSGTQLSGPGMRPRFQSNVLLKPGFKRANLKKVRPGFTVPRHMSRRNKRNLRNNLIMLGEKKYFPISLINAPLDSVGRIDSLSDPPVGDGDSTRDGDQIQIRSIEFNWSMQLPGIAPDTSNIVRVIIFQWFPSSVPAVGSILLDTTTPQSTVISPYNHDNRLQFKILMDVKSTLSVQGQSVRVNRKYIKSGMRRKVQFLAGSLTGENKIYALSVSDSALVGHPTYNFYSKVNYSDY